MENGLLSGESYKAWYKTLKNERFEAGKKIQF